MLRRWSLLLAVLIVLAAWIQPGRARADQPGDDLLKYLPDDCQAVVSLQVAECLKSGAWKDLRADFPEFEDVKKAFKEATNLTPDQVERVVVGFRSDRPPFFAARTSRELKVSDITAALKNPTIKESKVGGETLYENQTDANTSFVLIGGTTTLIGPADQLRGVLGRRGPPRHAPDLRDVLAKADFKQTCVCAADIKVLTGLGGAWSGRELSGYGRGLRPVGTG